MKTAVFYHKFPLQLPIWLCVVSMLLLVSCSDKENAPTATTDMLTPAKYATLLGRGMDVDWVKTNQGMATYSSNAPLDFKKAKLSHVRIRIADDADETLLQQLDEVVNDCLKVGLIPVIAYQANDFKVTPSDDNLKKVVEWWGKVAGRYKDFSPLLSFDIIIEVTDELNNQPETLNRLYEQAVAEIRKTNPTRIVFISPIVRSDPEYLGLLTIPSKANGFLMAEWHFYASGPSKTNPKKLWTTGTEEEKELIRQKIRAAVSWQQKSGILTWVGAWMPGNYNDGNDYSIAEQAVFAAFVAGELDKSNIPFAINSDVHFYDRARGGWIPEMFPVLQAILK